MLNILLMNMYMPIPVTAQSKHCGGLLAGIAGSNSAGGMDVCLS
jgi:hypothetical protein